MLIFHVKLYGLLKNKRADKKKYSWFRNRFPCLKSLVFFLYQIRLHKFFFLSTKSDHINNSDVVVSYSMIQPLKLMWLPFRRLFFYIIKIYKICHNCILSFFPINRTLFLFHNNMHEWGIIRSFFHFCLVLYLGKVFFPRKIILTCTCACHSCFSKWTRKKSSLDIIIVISKKDNLNRSIIKLLETSTR